MKTQRTRFSYGVGALAIIAISLGVAAIVYSLGILAFNAYNLVAWFIGPWGVYTVVYSFAVSGDTTYYLVWGTVMVALGIISGFYNFIPAVLVLGVLLIALAVIGLASYMKGRK
ncbi:MAG: hypothetical protein WCD81_01660 [Candidatus Bathyarchaeia archaeon]